MKPIRFTLVFLGFMMFVGGTWNCATTSSTPSSQNIPLPTDVRIAPPDPNLPKPIQALSGKWEGMWEHGSLGSLDAMLIVEKIDREIAYVIYASGDNLAWGVTKAWRREVAAVSYEDGKVNLRLPSGIDFWATKENRMEGRRATPYGLIYIHLKKTS